jgi:uncharacterized protein (DUF433 family)
VFKFDRITFDPQIMGGQACIRGMRIPVSLVVNLVSNGKQVPEVECCAFMKLSLSAHRRILKEYVGEMTDFPEQDPAWREL